MLACEVSDRKTARPLPARRRPERRRLDEKTTAVRDLVRPRAGVDDCVAKAQHMAVFEDSPQPRLQHAVIHGCEEAVDVALQKERPAPCKTPALFDRRMRPFPDPARIRVIDRPALQYRTDRRAKSVMDNTVPKRRGSDDAFLGIADQEAVGLPGLPCSGAQFTLQREQLFFEVPKETRHRETSFLSARGQTGGRVESREGTDGFEEPAYPPHEAGSLRSRSSERSHPPTIRPVSVSCRKPCS